MTSRIKSIDTFVNSSSHRKEQRDRTKYLELYRTDSKFINRLWSLALFEYRKSCKCSWHHISFFNVTRIIIEQYKKALSVWYTVSAERDPRQEQIEDAIADYERRTWLQWVLAQFMAEWLLFWYNVMRWYRKFENDRWRLACVPFWMYCPWYPPCAWEPFYEINKHTIYSQHTNSEETYVNLIIYEKDEETPEWMWKVQTHKAKNTLDYDPTFLIDHRVNREDIQQGTSTEELTDTLWLYFFNNWYTCHGNKRWYADSIIKPVFPLIRELMEITSAIWQDLIEQIRFAKMSVPQSTWDALVENHKREDSRYWNSVDPVTLDKDANLFTHDEKELVTQYIQKRWEYIELAFKRREQIILEISALTNIAPIKFGINVWWWNEPAWLKKERQEWYSDTIQEIRNLFEPVQLEIYEDMLWQEYDIEWAELDINFEEISQDEHDPKTVIDAKLAEIISATKAWDLLFGCTPEEIKEQKTEIQEDRVIASETWNAFLGQIGDLVDREESL